MRILYHNTSKQAAIYISKRRRRRKATSAQLPYPIPRQLLFLLVFWVIDVDLGEILVNLQDNGSHVTEQNSVRKTIVTINDNNNHIPANGNSIKDLPTC